MKFQTALFAASVLGLSASSSMAAVSLLGESGPISSSGGASQNASSLAFGLNYYTSGGFFSIATDILFSGQAIVQGDSGKSFVSNSSTDPRFPGFVALLTNGTPETVAGSANPGDTYSAAPFGGVPESFFFTLPAGSNGIDFEGFTIDHIDFLVSAVSINSPGSDPNEDGVWTDYSYTGTFQVFGEPIGAVPEPSSVGLIALGALGLVIRRRRSSK